jgi:hypothetical protein
MKTTGRIILVVVVALSLLGIGLIVIGMARADDPAYALFWSTGFSLIFLLAFPLGSALVTGYIAQRLMGQGAWLWGVLGFFFPVVAIVIVVVVGSIKRSRDVEAAAKAPPRGVYVPLVPTPPPPPPPRECPWCGSLIAADLEVCPNCAGRQVS